MADVVVHFGRAVADGSDVLEKHRPAVGDGDDQFAQLLDPHERLADVHAEVRIEAVRLAGGLRHVGRLEGLGDPQRRDVIGLHAVGVEIDVGDARAAADGVGPRDVPDRREAEDQLIGDASEDVVVGGGTGEREVDDGHVVDLDRLDDPALHARRDDVEVLVDALVQLDEAAFAVFADVEADGDDGLVRAGHRVDVLDAVDLVEDLLQRGGDELLDLFGAVAGEVDVHIGQRDDDLRVFLAGGQQQRAEPDQQRDQDQHDRKVRVQKDPDDRVGQPVLMAGRRSPGAAGCAGHQS